MPATRQSREVVLAQFRRAALIDAALRVFGACGFERATMEAIAAEADVAKGTIYLYYPSKRAIYDAAFEAGMAELDRLTADRIKQADGVKDAIAGFISVRTRYFLDRPDFFRMYVLEVSRQFTTERAEPRSCQAMLERQTRVLQQAIAQAVSRGEIRKVDPLAAATAVFDMTRGLVARRLKASPRADMTAETELCIDLIWNGITPRRGQKR